MITGQNDEEMRIVLPPTVFEEKGKFLQTPPPEQTIGGIRSQSQA